MAGYAQPLNVWFGPILLKNSFLPFFDFVQGVVEPLPDRRSSIVGDSERSIFLPDGAQATPNEFFNRNGRDRTVTENYESLLCYLGARVAFLKNLAKLGAKFRGVFMLVNSDRMLHRGLQQLCFAVSWKPIIPVSRSFPNDGRDCRRTLSPVRQRPCMIGSTVSAYGHG